MSGWLAITTGNYSLPYWLRQYYSRLRQYYSRLWQYYSRLFLQYDFLTTNFIGYDKTLCRLQTTVDYSYTVQLVYLLYRHYRHYSSPLQPAEGAPRFADVNSFKLFFILSTIWHAGVTYQKLGLWLQLQKEWFCAGNARKRHCGRHKVHTICP